MRPATITNNFVNQVITVSISAMRVLETQIKNLDKAIERQI